MSLDRTPKRRNSAEVSRTHLSVNPLRKASSYNSLKPKPEVIIEVPELTEINSNENSDKVSIELGNNYLRPTNAENPTNHHSSNVSKATSVQSLSSSIYREQYCCSPNCRFSPREKILSVIVGILATIIVILVIVVGFVASKDEGIHERFQWIF